MVCEKKKVEIKTETGNGFHRPCMNEISPFRVATQIGTAFVSRITGNGIRNSAIRIPGRAKGLSRLQNVQTCSGAHPVSY
jgi:hypothetical protein